MKITLSTLLLSAVTAGLITGCEQQKTPETSSNQHREYDASRPLPPQSEITSKVMELAQYVKDNATRMFSDVKSGNDLPDTFYLDNLAVGGDTFTIIYSDRSVHGGAADGIVGEWDELTIKQSSGNVFFDRNLNGYLPKIESAPTEWNFDRALVIEMDGLPGDYGYWKTEQIEPVQKLYLSTVQRILDEVR